MSYKMQLGRITREWRDETRGESEIQLRGPNWVPSRCNGKRASSVVITSRQEKKMMRVSQSTFDGEANSRTRVKLHQSSVVQGTEAWLENGIKLADWLNTETTRRCRRREKRKRMRRCEGLREANRERTASVSVWDEMKVEAICRSEQRGATKRQRKIA